MPLSGELPDILHLSAFGGDYQAYEDALFELYVRDVVRGRLMFRGQRVIARRTPEYKGKGAGFWHLTSEGKKEHERTPDLRRCERLPWVSWVIKAADSDDDRVRVWPNKRRGNTNFVLWLWEENYAVILSQRGNRYLLVSAYELLPHRKRKFEQEWLESQKKS